MQNILSREIIIIATYNAVIGLNPGSREIQRYGKMKLVPLGEKVPFADQFSFSWRYF